MAYDLYAVIGPAVTLGRVDHPQLGPSVELADGFALRALDERWLVEETGVDPSNIDAMTDFLGPAVAGESHDCPLAYVAIETFAGPVHNGAIVWSEGDVVYRELIEEEDAEAPANVAMRMIGVTAAVGMDEFDTLGLGRHRSSESWI